MVTEKAKAVLMKINNITESDQKMASLSQDDRKILGFILKGFIEKGKATTAEELMKVFHMSLMDVIGIFSKLNESDLIHLEGKNIKGVYPFSADQTLYEVKYEGGSSFAMGALDSLMIPFILRKDVSIISACDHCGEKIEVEIKNGSVAKKEPAKLMVWIGMKYGEEEESMITKTLFFSSENHLQEWRKKNPNEKGEFLTLDEAIYVGREFYEGRVG